MQFVKMAPKSVAGMGTGGYAHKMKLMVDGLLALRSPEIMEHMPEVEGMTREARIALMKKGDATFGSMLKSWDKLKAILAAKQMPMTEIKRYKKHIMKARGHLQAAMRLADPKNPKVFEAQATLGINMCAAWFIGNMGYFEDLLRGKVLKPTDVEAEAMRVLPEYEPVPVAEAPAAELPENPEIGAVDPAEPVEAGIVEVAIEAGANARTFEGEVRDVIDEEGASHEM